MSEYSTLVMKVSIMLARDNTRKYVRDKLSKDITLKGIDSSWEGEISDSIFDIGSEKLSM